MKRLTTTLLALATGYSYSSADQKWNCPDGETARKAIISGEIKTWPHFTPGPGMRVQLQYPKTALSGQAKYIEGNGTTAGICQYYNHIGFVATFLAVGATKVTQDGENYWRDEFKESHPDQDDPENPMMEVCMKNKDELSYRSVGCSFLLPSEAGKVSKQN